MVDRFLHGLLINAGALIIKRILETEKEKGIDLTGNNQHI
jgi:hypothetical protein